MVLTLVLVLVVVVVEEAAAHSFGGVHTRDVSCSAWGT